MLTSDIFEKNEELVTKLIATKKRISQKSAIVVVAHKDTSSVDTVIEAAFANNMSSIDIPAEQLDNVQSLEMVKSLNFMPMVVIVSNISKASTNSLSILNELIVNIYAGIPTWLHPESQLVLIDYMEDMEYGKSALESAALNRTTAVQFFGW